MKILFGKKEQESDFNEGYRWAMELMVAGKLYDSFGHGGYEYHNENGVQSAIEDYMEIIKKLKGK